MLELHLHLDGSLRPETVWDIACTENIDLGCYNAEDVKNKMICPPDCRDLNEYLDKFTLPLMVFQKASHIERFAYELTQDLAKEGLEYAEIRFAPSSSMKDGLSQTEVTEAVISGIRRAMKECPSITVSLILCCMRGSDNHALNIETINVAKKYLGKGVCAIDLAGAEAIFPTSDFEDLFRHAFKLDIPYTIHAGEAAGPDSIAAAIDFGAKRIGHGVNCIYDPELIERIIKENVTLEICPQSNIDTKVFPNVNDYPIKKLFDMGVKISLNTDNRTVSNTNLPHEISLAHRFGMTDSDIETMWKYAKEAKFN
ncbi:MAG: adenosine deaminase [Butyrivibrio sp.]|nr:adenosine deaminase [Butyrivibrio sp.]